LFSTVANDFCNKICTSQKCSELGYLVVIGVEADIRSD